MILLPGFRSLQTNIQMIFAKLLSFFLFFFKQEIGTASGATRRTFMFGERHKEVSVMSYHSDGDSIEGRNKRRTTHDPHVSGMHSIMSAIVVSHGLMLSFHV